MYGVALLASTLLSIASARVYERCELARDLLKLGVRQEHVATWVCIAYHESRLDTAARNPSSGDHGLLQISQLYWCGAGKACGLPCSALRDDNIADDVQCAQTIYEEHTRLQGNGFLAWVVYPTYCKHNPKKYLANCDLSAKDASHSMEERGRSSNIYDPYLTVNETLSNIVQSAPYPQSDRPLPGYLAIAALLRGKFESDFERDYNNRYKVSQFAPSRSSYVDDRKYDFISPFTTKRPKTTTTTTTAEPEPYYPPVKPWRVIETNQFRRKKMKFDKAPAETDKVITNFINTFVKTAPIQTLSSSSTEETISALILSSSNVSGTFGNTLKTLNTISETPTTSPSPFTTKQSSFNTFTSSSTQSFSTNPNPPKTEMTIKSERINPLIYSNTYSRTWTTPKADLRRITSTQKPVEAFNTNKSVLSTKRVETEYKATSLAPISTTSIRPSQDKADKQIINLSQSKVPTSYIFRNTSPVVQVTTIKPTTVPTQGTTKIWTVRPPLLQQSYSQNKTNEYQFVTENPLKTWRRGKSQPNVFQEVTPFEVNKQYTTNPFTTPQSLLSTTTQYFNRSKPSQSAKQSNDETLYSTHPTPVTAVSSTPNPNPVVDASSNQKRTESSTLPTPKAPQSIFDLYLNPTKKTQLPNYRFLFSNKSASNFKIFSGGTTAAPVIGGKNTYSASSR